MAPQVLDIFAALWTPADGRVRALPPLRGDHVSAAVAVNNAGQVVGGSGICGFPGGSISKHAILWERGATTNLGTLGGTFNNIASAINARGDITGISNVTGDVTTHAFLWTKQRGMRDLGTLPGDVFSQGEGINNQGTIVGNSCDSVGNCRAFVWRNGTMFDLNALISPRSSLQLTNAEAINNRGQVVGAAFAPSTGQGPAFLASPSSDKFFTESQVNANTHQITLPARVRQMLLRRRTGL